MRNLLLALSLSWIGCGNSGLPNGSGGDLAGSFDQSLPDDNPGVDLSSVMCLATCQHCQGVCCGAGCCNPGEWCDHGACRCGGNNGCASGQMCASPGPTMLNGCGDICCGNGTPCPL